MLRKILRKIQKGILKQRAQKKHFELMPVSLTDFEAPSDEIMAGDEEEVWCLYSQFNLLRDWLDRTLHSWF